MLWRIATRITPTLYRTLYTNTDEQAARAEFARLEKEIDHYPGGLSLTNYNPDTGRRSELYYYIQRSPDGYQWEDYDGHPYESKKARRYLEGLAERYRAEHWRIVDNREHPHVTAGPPIDTGPDDQPARPRRAADAAQLSLL